MVAVGLIVAAAALLRLHAAGRHCLELDDFWNAELSTGRGTVHESVEINRIYIPPPAMSLAGAPPWWHIPSTLQNVTHPPLFSIVLRWWRAMFGEGDVAMRILGAIFSAVAIIPLYALVALLSGRAAAMWTAALMAVATVPIMVAQEVRPYNLLLVLEMLAAWLAVKMSHEGATWRRGAAFAIACLAAMFTHYFAAPMLAAVWLYCAAKMDRRSNLRLLACVSVAAIVFAVAWGPTLWRQRAQMQASASIWLKDRSPHPPLATISRITEIPGRLLMTPLPSAPRAAQLSIILILAAAVLAVRRNDLRFYLLLFAGTTGFVALVDLAQGTNMLARLRYSLAAAPAVFAIIASLTAGAKPWLAQILPAAAVLGAAVSLPAAYQRTWPDYRPLAAHLDQYVGGDDIVVFMRRPGWEWHAGFQYATWSHYSRRPTPRCLFLDGDVTAELLAELRRAPAAWIVSHEEPGGGLSRVAGFQPQEAMSVPRADVMRGTFAR